VTNDIFPLPQLLFGSSANGFDYATNGADRILVIHSEMKEQ
jgi:hypothetical protein